MWTKWLTNAEIASRTGLPKPTVVHMAYTLCVLGYLRQSHESGKYALGDSVVGITMGVQSQAAAHRSTPTCRLANPL